MRAVTWAIVAMLLPRVLGAIPTRTPRTGGVGESGRGGVGLGWRGGRGEGEKMAAVLGPRVGGAVRAVRAGLESPRWPQGCGLAESNLTRKNGDVGGAEEEAWVGAAVKIQDSGGGGVRT